MKKLVAITLLVIHLFNFAGYNLLFQYCINQSQSRLIQKLDTEKYSDTDLMVLKMPLNLPYYNSSATAERVDGEIEISGTHYNYVKRQVVNDTLYLYCIPNTEKTTLAKAQTEYSKQASDTQSDNQKGGNALLKKMKWGGEYNLDFFKSAYVVAQNVSTQKTGFIVPDIASPLLSSPYQPPEKA